MSVKMWVTLACVLPHNLWNVVIAFAAIAARVALISLKLLQVTIYYNFNLLQLQNSVSMLKNSIVKLQCNGFLCSLVLCCSAVF